ncbi:rod shape-determining protein RodA [Zhaonella formicivorans]|uniref:rod shape-determining protein RodA n=1 Tax=Zhaonella formicivorans TaxID=2528593 RepID=UPI0010DF7DAF|nr:rod shape-determining protein RodA [Zhaonella formicivorans]
MIEKKLLKNLDWVFLLAVIAILIMSALVLASASSSVVPDDPYYYARKHLLYIATGLGLMFFAAGFNYVQLARMQRFLYVLNLLFLGAVLVPGVGKVSNGAQSWIGIGSFTLQPSEFAKVFLIITFAQFLVSRQGRLNTFKDLIPCFLYVAGPLVLIFAQPDLGTSLVFIAIMFGMMLVAGANPKILALLFFGGIFLIVAVLWLHFHLKVPIPLEDYQIMRLVVFLDPYADGKNGLGAGYNIIQSLVAVGSGGFWGKGLFKGTQGQYNFLPYHHTDFIFSIIGEELGFVGGMLLLILYFILLYRALRIAMQAKDLYGVLLVTGVVSMLTFHILENIGMAIGMMPITGIPLPLFSYGGSNMWANLLALGIILSVNLRRQVIPF